MMLRLLNSTWTNIFSIFYSQYSWKKKKRESWLLLIEITFVMNIWLLSKLFWKVQTEFVSLLEIIQNIPSSENKEQHTNTNMYIYMSICISYICISRHCCFLCPSPPPSPPLGRLPYVKDVTRNWLGNVLVTSVIHAEPAAIRTSARRKNIFI